MISQQKRLTRHYSHIIPLAAAAIMFIGCSDDDEETSVDQGVSVDTLHPNGDNGVDGPMSKDDQGAGDISTDTKVGTKKATDVQLGLHNNKVKVVLSSMEVLGEQVTEYDFFLAHDAVDSGPNMKLGPGVTAINLGSEDDYHAVNSAPDSGYEADDDSSQSWVIGNSWRAGGDGTEGFIMSNNVYVLKLADGTYGKIKVLSAKSGEVHVLCYHQPGGTKDITTEE